MSMDGPTDESNRHGHNKLSDAVKLLDCNNILEAKINSQNKDIVFPGNEYNFT